MRRVLRLSVLGPVELWADGVPVDLGPPRQRLVLAALAVDAGQLVGADALIERVWGSAARPGARSGLHSYVARLRRALAAGAPGSPVRLLSRAGGYQLDLAADSVDVLRFRRTVRATPAAAGADWARREAARLEEAVELWRGPALAGLPGDWAARTRHLLEQERIDAMVLWAAAELRAGRPGVVVDALRGLVEEHPLVEPLAIQLIEALGRDGRTAEALARYAATRRRLIDGLGVQPGPSLRRLEEALLAGIIDHASP